MIDTNLFEPANPLIPVELLPDDVLLAPGWNNRKLSIARLNQSVISSFLKNSDNKKLSIVPETTEHDTAEQVTIQPSCTICDPLYNSKLIYERYRPSNLKQLRDFIHFFTKYRRIIPNTNEIEPHDKKYPAQ